MGHLRKFNTENEDHRLMVANEVTHCFTVCDFIAPFFGYLWKLRSIIFPKMDNRQISENLGHIFQCERVSVMVITHKEILLKFSSQFQILYVVNLDFHMKTDPGLSWVSNNRENSVEFPTICRICNHAPISSKWPFWFTEMAILWLKKYFSSIATYLEPKNTIFDQQIVFKLFSNYFQHFKMAITEYKNGHFEEIRAWFQILDWGSNSAIFCLKFDTHDSPRVVFIWKWEIFRPHLLVWHTSLDTSVGSLNW